MSGEGQKCRICGLNYLTGSPDDSVQHREAHQQILRGGLPLGVRELLKSAGYELIAGNTVGQQQANGELGKLAVVFGWWTRARANGIPDSELNDFFAAHLALLDARQDDDENEIEDAHKTMKRWEKYAG